MIEKIYLGSILFFFMLAFGIRNVKTYLSERISIKGKSLKLTTTVLLSTIIYLLIVLRLTVLKSDSIFEIDITQFKFVKIVGLIFVTIGFIIGIFALITMKNSWRVGIKYDQKTKLVTNGIYRFSRNPYFLSYDILIFAYMLVFPSPLLLVLYIPLVIFFHLMILEEEKYLESVHGEAYLNYKKKVSRYFAFKYLK